MVMQNVEYHVHVNHFEEEPPNCLKELTALGFTVKESCLVNESKKGPLWLIAKKMASSRDRDEYYEKASILAKNDRSFRGYIEAETVPSDNVTIFDTKISNGASLPFPIKNVRTVSFPKTADIHVYMDKKGHNDQLDRILEQYGFYEVQTPNKKIWTLLLSDVPLSLRVYQYLKSYFNQTGGILELELEFIKTLQVLPGDYLLPKCIKTVQCELIDI